jgi:hypothetical protein
VSGALQLGFSDYAQVYAKKKTRRQIFLDEMEATIPLGLPESYSDHVSAGLNASQYQHSFDVVSQLPDALPN